MTDNNNLIVYCEIEDGRVADVSLELLTKGRVLASNLGVKLEAIAIGDNLKDIEKQIFPYGADTVYKVEDSRLYPYTSNPHAAVLINLFKQIKPQICLMGATCIGRDLGPRVSSCLHSGLTADCTALEIGPTKIPKPARNTPTSSTRSVPLSAATSWPLSSTPTAGLRWPPCVRV